VRVISHRSRSRRGNIARMSEANGMSGTEANGIRIMSYLIYNNVAPNF
jgi:hypothetical protein